MRPIRLLLVDDIERVRAALRTMLQCEPDFEVVGEAGDGETAMKLARQASPDVILLDLALPRIDGIEVIRRLRREGCEAHVVVLTLYGGLREEAAEAGADLFLEKGISPDELLAALENTTAAGRVDSE